MSTPKIYIAGAGVSGLVCAIELEKAGFKPVIYESSNSVGGRLATDIIDGVPLDHGFQVLLTAYPALQRYLNLDKLNLKRFRPGAAIISSGKIHRFGDFTRDRSFFPSTLTSPCATLTDKFNTYLLSRRLRKKKIKDLFDHSPGSTMGYLQAKGFSKKMIDSFFVPFYGGIFLESELTTPASMFAFTFKMFSSGYAAIPANGMVAIADQLRSKLRNTEIHFNKEVRYVNSGEITLETGETLPADAVIWTCPPQDLEPELKWRGCSTHYFTTDKNILNDRIIGLLPQAKSVNSLHYVTDLIPESQDDKHILSVTSIGKADTLIDDMLADLDAHCGLRDLELIKSYRIHHALPDLTVAKYAPSPAETRMMPGIYRAGDVMANSSLNAAMESGRAAAAAVKEDLFK